MNFLFNEFLFIRIWLKGSTTVSVEVYLEPGCRLTSIPARLLTSAWRTMEDALTPASVSTVKPSVAVLQVESLKIPVSSRNNVKY